MARLTVDDIYFDFEQRYRGSRDEIRARLSLYAPLLALVHQSVGSRRAFDYGCGRGEWLETVGNAGFDALGVDLNEEMLASCRTAGLAVDRANALGHVRSLPGDCAAIVSAFHFVEHIGFDELLDFLGSAHAALEPGGLLLLETPNPENLAVGACTFYSDPTHVRPLPPRLLHFCVEAAGFDPVCILRLNSAAHVLNEDNSVANVVNRLIGVSPDYAVVAIKPGRVEVEDHVRSFVDSTTQPEPTSTAAAVRVDSFISSLNDRVAEAHGRFDIAESNIQRETEARAGLFDQVNASIDEVRESTRVRIEAGEAELSTAVSTLDRLHETVQKVESALQGLHEKEHIAENHISRLQEAGAIFDARSLELEQRIRFLGEQLEVAHARHDAILASRSWRITAPLRRMSDLLKYFR